jgi:hypothetical protein
MKGPAAPEKLDFIAPKFTSNFNHTPKVIG